MHAFSLVFHPVRLAYIVKSCAVPREPGPGEVRGWGQLFYRLCLLLCSARLGMYQLELASLGSTVAACWRFGKLLLEHRSGSKAAPDDA